MEQSDAKEILEKHLMLFKTELLLPQFVVSIQDIYQNRSYLKMLPCRDFAVNYLTKIVLQTIADNKRFRVLDCLKVIKSILKNTDGNPTLEEQTITQLFSLYTKYIFHKNENVQWCASIYLKDQELTDEQVKWLIDNVNGSPLIVNRLLRYPTDNGLVKKWASETYQNGTLMDRSSELIGILIDLDLPGFVQTSDVDAIIWGVYYAKVPIETKEKLLKKYYSVNSLDSVLNVLLRLELPSVLEYILHESFVSESRNNVTLS